MIKKLLFVLIAVIIGLTFFIQPSRAFDKTEVRNFEPLKWVSEDNRSELILTCSLPNCLAGTFFYDGVGVKFESLVKKDQRIFNIFSLEEGDLITSFKASNKKMDFNYLNKKFCVAIDKKGLDAILESIGQEIFSENLQKKSLTILLHQGIKRQLLWCMNYQKYLLFHIFRKCLVKN